jgi:hypothetical protein
MSENPEESQETYVGVGLPLVRLFMVKDRDRVLVLGLGILERKLVDKRIGKEDRRTPCNSIFWLVVRGVPLRRSSHPLGTLIVAFCRGGSLVLGPTQGMFISA